MKSWIFTSGWNSKTQTRVRYRGWILCFFLLVSAVNADDEQAMFDEAFLEFLGSWETADGEWIAPDEIESMLLSGAVEPEATSNSEANSDE